MPKPKKMKSIIKITIASMIYKAMQVLPISENRIFFQSYEKADGFIDNPKYICQFLFEAYQDRFEYIFALKRPRDTEVEYIHKIRYGSIQWFYFLATSKVIIVNCWMPDWLKRKKNQLVINTWHAGGSYKSVGIHRTPERQDLLEKRINNLVNLFVSSSQAFTESNIEMAFHYRGEILPCGMPRNDGLFSRDFINRSSEKVRSQYNIGKELCVLYAPTFRRNQEEKILILPPLKKLAKLLQEKTDRDVVILLRKHRWDKNTYDIHGIAIDASDYPDTQELLCCSDILITDYSSIIWDYALLGRPCFLFVPDKVEYEKDQGVFTPMDKWPGILCHNGEELLREMKELDPERSRRIAEQYLEEAGSYENGHAAETLANYIYRQAINQ